jgi:hypothetical protein
MHRPRRHSGAWDEKSVGGDGAFFVIEGTAAGLYQVVQAQSRLEVGSAWCQQAHSTSCAAAMAWISAS